MSSEFALRRIVVEPFKELPPRVARQTRGRAELLMNGPPSAQALLNASTAET